MLYFDNKRSSLCINVLGICSRGNPAVFLQALQELPIPGNLENAGILVSLSVCTSVRTSQFYLFQIPAVVTNKSCSACVKSEKYVVWVTLRPLGSMRQGEAKLCILKLLLVYNRLPRVSPKQLYVLAHLGCTREAGTSQFSSKGKRY